MTKTVLITGASSGIGWELAKIFAEKKYRLVLVARTYSKLHTFKLEHPHNEVVIIQKDLIKPHAAKELYYEVAGKGLHIDALVNNAGFGDYGFFHESNWGKQQEMIDLNISVLTELCYLFGNDMIKNKKGRVLNLASTAAFQPGPLMSVYYATKHFVLAFSEAIANEWKPLGITVTALCPGPTESNFANAANAGSNKMFHRKLPTSREVAIYGYNAMIRGKNVAIYGLGNKVLVFGERFMPRNLITKIVRKLSENS